MRNWMLAAGAAALAIGAPALSQGNGNGGGNGGGGGGPKADRGPAKADRGNRGGGDNRGPKMNNGGRPDRQMVERGPRNGNRGPAMRGNGNGKADKAERVVVRSDKGNGNGNGKAEWRGNGKARHDIRVVDAVRDDGRLIVRDFSSGLYAGRGIYDGCPPGLAKKDNGCLPPGQAMKLVGAPLQAAFAGSMLPYEYRNWYRDNDDYYYRYGDDYIYQIGRNDNLVDGLIPLFGNGYYMVGDPWPQPYDFYNVPYQYRSYWADGSDYRYRYGDGAIYQIDAGSSAVSSIVALLAGDLGVGSRLPMGYDTYNVPFAYRDRYYDTTNDWYRYNDGYIYRVDPTTRLITAVIDAIV